MRQAALLFIVRKPNGAFVCLAHTEFLYKAFGLEKNHLDKILRETAAEDGLGECTLFLKAQTICVRRAGDGFALWELAKELEHKGESK